MRFTYIAVAALALALGFAPRPADAQTPARDSAAACQRLAADTGKFLAIPEAPTTVVSATIVKAGGEGTIIDKDLPEICRVEGFITPSIGFLLRMPTKNWNGKFMMGGCGASCGNFLEDRIDPALVRNYAVVTTDMGHKGMAVGFPQFTNTLQGQVDFGYRSTHVTAVAAKVLVAEFYGQKASRNYFWGCSTGGAQAMVEAQFYPNDFEGIIAGGTGVGPSPGYAAWRPNVNRGADDKPILTREKLPMLHRAVLEACDALDGLKDGFLQNPRQCKWEPSALRCKQGQPAAECLSAAEVEVVQRFYDGPLNDKGQPIAWGLMERGSEDQWGHYDYPGVELPGLLAVAPKTEPPVYEPWFRNPRNPDLRPLKRAGTKLIMFMGLNDNNVPPGAAIDYYETVMKTMGGEKATKEFFRFFAMPAANHCRYGIGGGEADWITYLENWVEKGQAPDSVIAYHMRQEPYPFLPRKIRDYGAAYVLMPRFPLPASAYDRTRPVYAYPDVATYSGSGDPAKAENWKVAPRSSTSP